MMKMKKRKIAPLCMGFLLFAAGSLFASPFSMISAGDPVLEDIRFLVRESGGVFRSFTPPLSPDEVWQILDSIDASALSAAGSEAYGRIIQRLKPSVLITNGYFSFDAHVTAAVEGGIRSNGDIPWQVRDAERPPMLALPLNFFFADALQLAFEPILASDPWFYESASHWRTNIPYEAKRFDLNFPLRAFVAGGGSWWNFQLGRDRLSFGAAHTGNFAVSDSPDFYEFFRASFFSPAFKYSILVSQMPLSVSGLLSDTAKAALTGDELTNTTDRYLYLHRLDVRLFNKVSVGLTEGAIVGNSLELRYLNPFAIFHSFFAWHDYDDWGAGGGDMEGSIFSLDLEWAIIPSLTLYGQFVLTEFSTPYELKRWPDTQPPQGLGYLAGIEYARDVKGWGMSLYGEFVYTDPFLYMHSSPFASFIWMRHLSETTSKPRRYAWIGHPDGRDMMLFAVGSSIFKGDLGFSFELSGKFSGEHSLSWDWGSGPGYNDQKSPSGVAENTFSAVLGAKWKLWSRHQATITLAGHLAGVMVFNAAHIQDERKMGAETMLSLIFSY
jgi:hypothetical protein